MTTQVPDGPERGVATRAETGRPCPYCRFPLKEGDGMVRCGACSSAHHADCWDDNGDGCAIVACPGGPAAGPRQAATREPALPAVPVIERKVISAQPAAVPPHPAPPAQSTPAAPAPRAHRGPWILAAAIVVALALASAALAVVLTQRSGEGERAAAKAGAASTAATADEPPETLETTTEEAPSGGEAADGVPTLTRRITANGWVADMPGTDDGWRVSAPERQNGGRQIVRMIEGPAGEVITVVHTPHAVAQPAQEYITGELEMTTAAKHTRLVTVEDFPRPPCESRTCSDILLNDDYGGIALLVNGERGDAKFAVADAIARTVRRTDQAGENPHTLAPAPGSDESLSPESYNGE
ncbi:MAG TPA: RING finger protein [Solirubrobacteraceae bacterium]|jgi:hypothetical protein